VRRELEAGALLAPPGGGPTHRFVVSDDEPHFRRLGARFLGEPVQDVELVPL